MASGGGTTWWLNDGTSRQLNLGRWLLVVQLWASQRATKAGGFEEVAVVVSWLDGSGDDV